MEEDQLLDLRRAGEVDGFTPRAVSPTLAVFIFFGRVLRVVNQNVGVLCVVAKSGVRNVVAVFMIACVNDRRAGRLDAIAGCAVRVMQGEGANDEVADASGRGIILPINEFARHRDWIIRRQHLRGEDAFRSCWFGARMNARDAIRMLEGREERDALDVVPMEVGEEEMKLGKRVAQGADSCSGVEDQQRLIGVANGEAGSVSTVAEILGDGSGYGSANAPKRQI